MEYELWDKGLSKYVDGWFSEIAAPPTDYEKYREVMSSALEDLSKEFDVSTDRRIVIAFYDEEVFKNRHDDDYPSDFAYRSGYSVPAGYKDIDDDTVFMAIHREFSERVENWEGILKYAVCHEIAHQEFFDEWFDGDLDMSTGQRVWLEGHAMVLAEEMNQRMDYNVDYPFLELPELDSKDVKKALNKATGGREGESSEQSGLFSYGGEKFENAEGYPLSYNIGQDILDREGISPEDLPRFREEDAIEQISKSIDALLS